MPTHGADLEKIFSRQETRVVRADNTVSYRRRIFQIEPQKFRYSLAKCRVLVCEHLDGSLSLHYGPHRLGRYDRQGQLVRGQQTERLMAWRCVRTQGNQLASRWERALSQRLQGGRDRNLFIHRPDRSLVTKTGQLDVLLTAWMPLSVTRMSNVRSM